MLHNSSWIDAYGEKKYIMKNFTEIFSGNADGILHFAPESTISNKLKKKYGEQYISADIMEGRADVVADITKLQFDNEQFEYIIYNHVMEHVYEEKKAFEVGLAFSFRGLIHDHHDKEHGGRWVGTVLEQ